MKISLFLAAILFTLYSCSGTKTISQEDKNNLVKVEELLNTKRFSVEAQWAYPLTTGSLTQLANAGLLGNGNNVSRINLLGNANFLRIKNDSIHMYLPYYGERRVGGGYNSSNAVEAKNVINDYKIEDHPKKNAKVISFNVYQKTEMFNVIITTFSNKKTNIVVNSNQRSNIRYDGDLDILKTEKL